MRSLLRGLSTVSCALAAGAAWAQGIEIDHPGVGCVVAGRHPTIEARLRPASRVARAETLFRKRGTSAWYAVTMTPEGGRFVGVLPSPRPDIGGFEYFIDVTAVDLGASRSPEFSPEVVAREDQCGSRLMAAGLVKAPTLLLRAPAGAPPMPAGFLSAGIAGVGAPAAAAGGAGAAGAGSGPAAALLIAGGVAVAGGAVAVAASGGEEDSSSPTTSAATPSGPTTPLRYYEIRFACAELNGVQVGSTIGFQDGIGRWPTLEAARAAMSGHSATITLDGVPLAVTYEGLTWHTGGETEPGYGDRARAAWQVTAGTHTVVARWSISPSAANSCTFTAASR